MNGNHPKRRKDKYNPYNIFEKEGRYFLSFRDGEGAEYTQEIDQCLFAQFNRFELDDLSQLNEWDRHIEHSELTEISLNMRAQRQEMSIEDVVIQSIDSELLHSAIAKLPEVQRRRLELYFFEDMTYEQIAEIEGCSFQAIAKSIIAAISKLRNFFDDEG